ncbi:Uncharacterized protein OBRU01_07905 [Operophtera brumata]|uniref:Uncharacterized protein n=1 Tax=Operophtera brumata TaxID=104452 RepID=A0A0L7LIK3_OPEBR|nr:Uncharacterized protein OBRU01_07905 [Operophtera brumata]
MAEGCASKPLVLNELLIQNVNTWGNVQYNIPLRLSNNETRSATSIGLHEDLSTASYEGCAGSKSRLFWPKIHRSTKFYQKTPNLLQFCLTLGDKKLLLQQSPLAAEFAHG